MLSRNVGNYHYSLRNNSEELYSQGDALSPLLLHFAYTHTITKAQVSHDCLKSNSTHQLLVYADDVNIVGGSVHTVMKST